MKTLTFAQMLLQPPLWLALVVAAAFAALAGAARWLTRSGAISTFLVGFVVFGFGGGKFAVPLLTFFFTSSLLSRLGRSRKAQGVTQVKGATRDAWQVWANGGVATGLVAFYALVVHRWPLYETRNLLMLYLAALASVNADTWATEIGGLAASRPRLITNLRPVTSGTSGGISAMGLVASLAGAMIVPLSAFWLWHLEPAEFIAVTWAGFMASMADSVLGATVQALYKDPQTGLLTEHTEVAGQKTERVRGLAWMNNDMVNFLASVLGVLFALAFLRYGN